MSTKNIALDSKVYRKLAKIKRESESFSKAIDRILDEYQNAHTGGDILTRLADMPELSQRDADAMLRVLEEARQEEEWKPHDLG